MKIKNNKVINKIITAGLVASGVIGYTGIAQSATSADTTKGQKNTAGAVKDLTSIQTLKNSKGSIDIVLTFSGEVDTPNSFNVQDATGGMIVFDFKNSINQSAPKILPPKDSDLSSVEIKEAQNKMRLVVRTKSHTSGYNITRTGNVVTLSFNNSSAPAKTFVAEASTPVVVAQSTPVASQPTPVVSQPAPTEKATEKTVDRVLAQEAKVAANVQSAQPTQPAVKETKETKETKVAPVSSKMVATNDVVSATPKEAVKNTTANVVVTEAGGYTPTQVVTLKPEVKDVSFKKGKDASSALVIDLTDPKITVDIRPEKNDIIIDLFDTVLPKHLVNKKINVSGEMTPVQNYNFITMKDRSRIVVHANTKTEQSAYQVDNKLVLTLKPVYSDTIVKDTQNKKYTGSKVTLNFQNIDVRALLQVIADYSNFNIVASDAVTGNVTLRLKDIPWDQALDILLQTKNLGQKQNGNVIWIAPLAEIRAKEKADLDHKTEMEDKQPLLTESFQINYQKAADIQSLLSNQNQRIISKRGSVMVDPKTNQLFVQDTQEKIDSVRAMIKKVDIPVRQVMIEAKIVEANKNFAKNVGSRLGINGRVNRENAFGGSLEGTAAQAGEFSGSATLANTLGVSLPASAAGGATPGVFSFILFNRGLSRFLNMEISAAENDGSGNILSNPRVVTADQNEATIEQGTQIPYQSATSSGATSVSFKNATLSMKVKPQITPDGNVLMDLTVNKDSVGVITASGPSIDTKNIKTQVLVENEGTVAIGGIYTEEETKSADKVPFLGDLPYVGFLFKRTMASKTQREIIVFITPKIVADMAGLNEDNNVDFKGRVIKEIPVFPK